VQNVNLNHLYEPLLNDVDSAKPNLADFEWARADLASPGLRRDDKPFQPCLVLVDPQGMAQALALPLCSDALVNAAISALVANLVSLVQVDEAEWLFYGRDNNHYSRVRRYVPSSPCHPLARGTDPDSDQQEPCAPAFASCQTAATRFDRRELIVLRGADGQPLAYRESARVYAMRRDVIAHNAFLQGFDITVVHPEAHYDNQGYLVIDSRRLNPSRTTYYRIFNGRFTQGGRWYGPWWQSVPSRCRTGIRINGKPTCEPDIQGCHMHLLSARAGVKLGAGDPYEGLGLPRNEVKLAVNVMLNASTWSSARGALIARLTDRYGPSVGSQVDRLRTAIQKRFPTLDPFWNTGYGLTLQRIDANICERLQRRLRGHGVPALSVHDSFVVPQFAGEFTTRVMREEFDRARHRLSAKS
jgi:hypothetical protein